MDEAQTRPAPLDAFMQSEIAETVIRPGSETRFAVEVDAWIRTLNLDRWEGDAGFPDYLNEHISTFLEHAADAGHIEHPGVDDYGVGWPLDLWNAVYALAESGLEARYAAEVEEGTREDLWAPLVKDAIPSITGHDGQSIEQDRDDAPVLADTPRTITQRVQALMQVIADYVRGRDVHEHGDELGR